MESLPRAVFRELQELAQVAPLTSAQVACFLAYAISLVLLVVVETNSFFSSKKHERDSEKDDEKQDLIKKAGASSPSVAKGEKGGEKGSGDDAKPRSFMVEFMSSGLFRCLQLDHASLAANRKFIRAAAEFGTLMAWFFVADRTAMLPEGGKTYSRDTFFFVYGLLVVYSFTTRITEWKTPVLLNRLQTEEWKGWMQVLFLLYHYFEARELYNAIRVFISAYVWMTGFGNFLYYYKTRDFSIGRFAEMMWRLNFLVFFCCLVLNNSYMLYYICPMHTLFTVYVYVTLALFPSLNENRLYLLGKILAAAVFVYVCWDIKSVFYATWQPLDWLVGYTDPRRPGPDRLHEWYFRSGLDRYVWIYGMLCGYAHPYVESFFHKVDGMERSARYAVRALVAGAALLAASMWYNHIYTLPKLDYNAIHPYTSWIPITIWIFLRNLTPYMRTFSLGVFGWLGCITLETYMGQFHTWLSSSIPDGQPVGLLVLLPGYPLLNFMAVTAVYIYVSFRLFNLTVTLKHAAVPDRDAMACAVNFGVMTVCAVALWVAGFLVLETSGLVKAI